MDKRAEPSVVVHWVGFSTLISDKLALGHRLCRAASWVDIDDGQRQYWVSSNMQSAAPFQPTFFPISFFFFVVLVLNFIHMADLMGMCVWICYAWHKKCMVSDWQCCILLSFNPNDHQRNVITKIHISLQMTFRFAQLQFCLNESFEEC